MSGLKKRKAPAPRSAARVAALAQVQESLASGWDGNLANKRKKNVSDLKGQDDSSHPVSEGKEQKTEAVDSADTSNSNSHTLPTDFFDANADDELDAFEREVAAISSSEYPPAAVRKEEDEVGDAVDAVEEAVARINADAVTRSNDWERLQDCPALFLPSYGLRKCRTTLRMTMTMMIQRGILCPPYQMAVILL